MRGAGTYASPVKDSSQVASVRAESQRMARDLGFDETRIGRVGIVATEAATNVLKHAGGGSMVVRALEHGGMPALELLAIDSGPGMDDFDRSARDGHSTAGTPGNGLGAIRRLAEELDVYSVPDKGTILRMVVAAGEGKLDPDPAYSVGAVTVAKAGEPVSGDAWGDELRGRGATFLVADGLGHGVDASHASGAAVAALRRYPEQTALRVMDLAHARLRPTRGAAVAVISDDGVGEASFVGVGNISAAILDGTGRRAMVSHNGIVGHNVHKSVEYRYPWPRGALLVAHTDGLGTQWDLGAYPGLASHHPSVIAAVLFREHARGRDDCTVLVVRTN